MDVRLLKVCSGEGDPQRRVEAGQRQKRGKAGVGRQRPSAQPTADIVDNDGAHTELHVDNAGENESQQQDCRDWMRELRSYAVVVLAQEVEHQPDEADRERHERERGHVNEPRLVRSHARGAEKPDSAEGGAQIAWMIGQLRYSPYRTAKPIIHTRTASAKPPIKVAHAI